MVPDTIHNHRSVSWWASEYEWHINMMRHVDMPLIMPLIMSGLSTWHIMLITSGIALRSC
jgi:hypothetical protein